MRQIYIHNIRFILELVGTQGFKSVCVLRETIRSDKPMIFKQVEKKLKGNWRGYSIEHLKILRISITSPTGREALADGVTL